MTPMTAFAQNFDPDRVGSISVALIGQDGKTPIAGAELSLYYVATVKLNSKNNLIGSFDNSNAFRWDFYVHFTNISNFLCIGIMLAALIQTARKNEDSLLR